VQLHAQELLFDVHRDDGKRFVVRADRKADGVCGIGSGDSLGEVLN
jgi:hypothetical protein